MIHQSGLNNSSQENSLQENEDLVRILVQGVKDYAIFTINRNGIITSWNEGAKRMKGYNENEIIGKHFSVLYLPHEVKQNKPLLALETAAIKGAFEEEGLRLKKDGTTFWAHALLTALYNEDGTLKGFAKVTRDVTIQHEIEQENKLLRQQLEDKVKDLEESESKLTAVIENAESMVWSIDKEGRLETFNNAFCEAYRDAMQSLPQKGDIIYDFLLKVKETLIDFYKRALNGEKVVYERAIDIKGKKTHLRFSLNPIILNNEVTGLACFAADLTDKVLYEQKLQEYSEQLQSTLSELEKVFNFSADMICTIDSAGRFMHLSQASENILGYKPEELLGKSYIELVVEEDIEKTAETSANIQSGATVRAFENRYYRKDGTIVPLVWSAYWSQEEETMFCVARDVTDQKKLEEAYKRERERFEDLFMQAPVCIRILKGHEHVFEMANPLYLKTFGKKEVIGKPIREIFSQEGYQEYLDLLDSVYKTGKSFVGKEMLIKVDREGNGQLTDVFINFVYQAYKNKEGEIEGIFFFGIEVTEQVQARKKTEESEKRYRDLIQNLPAPIYTCDGDGRIVLYNKAAITLWGRKPVAEKDRYTGALKSYRKDGTLLSADYSAMALTLKRKKPFTYKEGTIIERPNGDKSHVMCHPTPIFNFNRDLTGAINVSIDITDIKKTEEELRMSMERYEIVIKATNDAIWDWNLSTGEVDWNKSYESLFGYTRGNKVQNIEDRINKIHPDDRERIKTGVMNKILDAASNFWQDEYRYIKADGETAYVLDRGYVIHDGENRPVRFVGAMQDISERKKNEREKEQLIEHLTNSNRDLRQFTYITSHNLRAPLSNLIGLLNMVEYNEMNDYNKELINMFQTSTRQLDQTINDLSQILIIKDNVNISTTKININEVFKNIRKYFLEDLETLSATINTNFECTEVNFNMSYFESILSNLVSNSLKYYSPDRNLVVNISAVKKENGDVLLTFSDNGVGIDMKRNKDRVFGLYQRFHSDTKGKGLGLYITKSQLDSLGGNIELESEVEKGTTFYITFKQRNN